MRAFIAAVVVVVVVAELKKSITYPVYVTCVFLREEMHKIACDNNENVAPKNSSLVAVNTDTWLGEYKRDLKLLSQPLQKLLFVHSFNCFIFAAYIFNFQRYSAAKLFYSAFLFALLLLKSTHKRCFSLFH